MKTLRATIHMALAAYLADKPDDQVLMMAKRVRKRTISKRTKATMLHVINCHSPAEMVKRVYEEASLTNKEETQCH